MKDVGRYRFSSNIFKYLSNIKYQIFLKYLETKLWKWFRCVELDYSQDQINIDYDYGEEWRVEETDQTETIGEEGKLNFMILGL